MSEQEPMRLISSPKPLVSREDRSIASALGTRLRSHGARRAAHVLLRSHGHRFATFLAVGLVGVVVANGGLVAVREILGLNVFIAGSISWQAAIVATFVLNSTITWRGATGRSLPRRFLAFEVVSLVGLGIYLATIAVSQGALHLHYLLGGLGGSGIAAVWNYTANHIFTFASEPERLREAA